MDSEIDIEALLMEVDSDQPFTFDGDLESYPTQLCEETFLAEKKEDLS